MKILVFLRVSGAITRQTHDIAELLKGSDLDDGHDYSEELKWSTGEKVYNPLYPSVCFI